ncbi:unnamed protein product [Orchesella dallaii]|uniref:Uncharacterized protein n=1 Tax=Orchesella dallaii TaxID=48710 RepID=A0ABP1R100_9HEXA
MRILTLIFLIILLLEAYAMDLEADDNPKSCRRAKKFYCVSDELCHSTIERAPDCFTNCYDTLTDDIHCSAIGCFFDYNQRRCYGPRNSAQRYAVNLCDPAMMDTKGNYFIAGEFPRSNSVQCSCRSQRLINATGDFGLYQCGRKARFSDLNITIPVYEDGIFELELYFAELSTSTAMRVRE